MLHNVFGLHVINQSSRVILIYGANQAERDERICLL